MMFKIKSTIDQIKNLLPKRLSSKPPQEIGVVLLNTEESARLNLIYRNKNKASNVLSFYYSPDYGEILICPEIVKKEAKEQGNTQDFQMTWMIVHGIIHLTGIHHERSQDEEKRSFLLEKSIMAKLPSSFKSEARSTKS